MIIKSEKVSVHDLKHDAVYYAAHHPDELLIFSHYDNQGDPWFRSLAPNSHYILRNGLVGFSKLIESFWLVKQEQVVEKDGYWKVPIDSIGEYYPNGQVRGDVAHDIKRLKEAITELREAIGSGEMKRRRIKKLEVKIERLEAEKQVLLQRVADLNRILGFRQETN